MRLRPTLLALIIVPVFAQAQKPKSIRLPVHNGGIYFLDVQSKLNLLPGDTLLIPKGVSINAVKMTNIHGTREKPIIITQEDTAAHFGGYKAYGFAMGNATYFKLRHIHVDGQNINAGVGILLGQGCSDFTIEHCSSDNNAVGIQCKVTPVKGVEASLFPTTMKNIRIENCSASNNSTEGFYIGYSAGAPDAGLSPILIDSIYIKNIRSINSGWDGIQITRAKNLVGKNWYVSGYGKQATPGQNSGIALQSDVTGVLDGFEVTEGDGAGLIIFARGSLQLKNGKLKKVGQSRIGDGIYVNDFPTGYNLPPLQLNLENVSIDGFNRFPIFVVNKFGTMKPGAFKNVTFKNGPAGKGIMDGSRRAGAK
jgi:hypothetical protein